MSAIQFVTAFNEQQDSPFDYILTSINHTASLGSKILRAEWLYSVQVTQLHKNSLEGIKEVSQYVASQILHSRVSEMILKSHKEIECSFKVQLWKAVILYSPVTDRVPPLTII